MNTRFCALIVLVLSLPVASFAQSEKTEPSLADLTADEKMEAAFDDMAGDVELPDWVKSKAVTSPGQRVSFDGKEYLAMTGCEQHQCGAHKIAVLYEEQSGTMYGLLSAEDEESGSETLTWLNIGGGPESIDGKTLLFAAVTGSIENHPEDFQYAQ